ncbi:hypothetical protein FACS1894105_14200 [Clostridia bacterium]|nr:hypothetical protein FACS1894105_14200 [Clostridia bacterium]
MKDKIMFEVQEVEVEVTEMDSLEDAFAPVWGLFCKGCTSSSAWGLVCG